MSWHSDALRRTYQRLLYVIGRGRVTFVNDSDVVQFAQVQLGDIAIRDGLPRLAEFGFTSNPPIGSDAIVVFVAGDRSNGAIIATGNQTYRMTGLAPGDSALHDSRGQSVWLTANGIMINGKTLPLAIVNAPTVSADGNLEISLTVTAGVDVIANGISLFNHTHPVSGATTGPPTG